MLVTTHIVPDSCHRPIKIEALNVRYALACRDVTERPSGKQLWRGSVVQRASLLRHDKLKHIGHLNSSVCDLSCRKWHSTKTVDVFSPVAFKGSVNNAVMT